MSTIIPLALSTFKPALTAILERLKEVEIVIGKGDEIEVRRKLGGINSESRTLIDVFNMATNSILPGVEQ